MHNAPAIVSARTGFPLGLSVAYEQGAFMAIYR